jgi:hypothetical protein
MRSTLWNQLYISILFKVGKLKPKLLLAFIIPFFYSILLSFIKQTQDTCNMNWFHLTNSHRYSTSKEYNEHGGVFRKVRTTRYQYPEFGPKPGEIFKKPAKKYISLQLGVKLRNAPLFVPNWVWSGFDPVFPFSWALPLLLHILSLLLHVGLM